MKNTILKKILLGINLLRKQFYEKQTVFIFRSNFKKIPSPQIKLIVKLLSFQDLQKLQHWKTKHFPKKIQKRLNDQEGCFGFFLNKQLVHTAWITPHYLKISKCFPQFKIRGVS